MYMKTELAKLGPTTASFLFIQLAQCPNYALVLEITEQSLRTALICVAGMIEGGQPSMAIHSIEWLDRARIVARSAGTSHLKRKRGQQDPEFGSR